MLRPKAEPFLSTTPTSSITHDLLRRSRSDATRHERCVRPARIPDAWRVLDDRRLLGYLRVEQLRTRNEEDLSGSANRRYPTRPPDLSHVLRHRPENAGAQHRLRVQPRQSNLGAGRLPALRSRYR